MKQTDLSISEANKELLQALRTLKSECLSNGSCETCPMLNIEGECGIRTTQPSEWELQPIMQHFKIKF